MSLESHLSRNHNLIKRLFDGDRAALSRLISLVESEAGNSIQLLDAIHEKVGRAYRIGVTGPPGAGKSTIVDGVTKHYREQGKTVGVIAVDPTSPFTGGALLGDRVRMTDVTLDDGVFIRSMATRGSLGGLSQKADDAADVLDAFGKDYVILETVGVGQSELDIVEVADSTVVVLVPESGDAVQAMKAGLMEIADLFVLNKADRAGADMAIQEITAMLQLRAKQEWEPEVVRAVANQGEGVTEIAKKIAAHRQFLQEKNILSEKRRERVAKKVQAIVRTKLEEAFWDDSAHQTLHESLQDLKLSPNQVADQLWLDFNSKKETVNER
jgi:LAO/AO transport system kinase